MVDEGSRVADGPDLVGQGVHLPGREVAEGQGHAVTWAAAGGVPPSGQAPTAGVEHVHAALERLFPRLARHRVVVAALLVPPDAATAQTVDAPGRGDRRHPHAHDPALDGRLDLGEVDGLRRDPDDPGRQALDRPQALLLGPAVDVVLELARDL